MAHYFFKISQIKLLNHKENMKTAIKCTQNINKQVAIEEIQTHSKCDDFNLVILKKIQIRQKK